MKTAQLIFIGIKGSVVALNHFTGQQAWATRLKGSDFVNVVLHDERDFSTAPSPDNPSTMFEKRSDRGYRPALDGIERKTLVHGEKTLMTEFLLRKGAVLPRHAHPHEQTGYLVKGRIRLLISE